MVVVIQFQLCALFPSFHDIAEQDDLIRFTYYLLLLLSFMHIYAYLLLRELRTHVREQ